MRRTKTEHLKQMTVLIQVNFSGVYSEWNLKAWLFKAGGWLIKVTTNTGFTVHKKWHVIKFLNTAYILSKLLNFVSVPERVIYPAARTYILSQSLVGSPSANLVLSLGRPLWLLNTQDEITAVWINTLTECINIGRMAFTVNTGVSINLCWWGLFHEKIPGE